MTSVGGLRQRWLRQRGGGDDDRMMDDGRHHHQRLQHNNQTLHGRGRRKMAVAMGNGRWMTTVMTTLRGDARGRKEEEHTMIEG